VQVDQAKDGILEDGNESVEHTATTEDPAGAGRAGRAGAPERQRQRRQFQRKFLKQLEHQHAARPND